MNATVTTTTPVLPDTARTSDPNEIGVYPNHDGTYALVVRKKEFADKLLKRGTEIGYYLKPANSDADAYIRGKLNVSADKCLEDGSYRYVTTGPDPIPRESPARILQRIIDVFGSKFADGTAEEIQAKMNKLTQGVRR